MREILFRAWDKFDKKFYKVQSIDFNCFGEIETIAVFENDSLCKSYTKKHSVEEHNINALILCQYTGLTDKNGKKIFDGDKFWLESEEEYGTIKWDNNSSTYMLVFDGWNATFDNFYGKELEVIGNIFDKEGNDE